ncbi:hypothetical protein BJ508DRAFT_332558 [Ascobolus immersus RN42]|uniref:Uncharacterized protein n=1 Tax=Ascobolus immersus RN42 TaxID=1160509 RepID=A0A3N4HNX7_ASCIM|nr:hypothetical protein BJ508DRAFT_332558 [Ascobolus immersus RN42]
MGDAAIIRRVYATENDFTLHRPVLPEGLRLPESIIRDRDTGLLSDNGPNRMLKPQYWLDLGSNGVLNPDWQRRAENNEPDSKNLTGKQRTAIETYAQWFYRRPVGQGCVSCIKPERRSLLPFLYCDVRSEELLYFAGAPEEGKHLQCCSNCRFSQNTRQGETPRHCMPTLAPRAGLGAAPFDVKEEPQENAFPPAPGVMKQEPADEGDAWMHDPNVKPEPVDGRDAWLSDADVKQEPVDDDNSLLHPPQAQM